VNGKEGEKKNRVCDRCLPTLVEERKFRICASDSYDDSRSSVDSRRTSVDSRGPSIDVARVSGSTIAFPVRDSTSIDIRRASIDSRVSFESSRSMAEVARLYNTNRSYGRRNSRILDSPGLFSRILGSNPSTPSSCTLCLQTFNLYLWKYQCRTCARTVCKRCCSKDYSYALCDPCALSKLSIVSFYRYRS
jgi:hypothetical protein